jgi:hypothetical protein
VREDKHWIEIAPPGAKTRLSLFTSIIASVRAHASLTICFTSPFVLTHRRLASASPVNTSVPSWIDNRFQQGAPGNRTSQRLIRFIRHHHLVYLDAVRVEEIMIGQVMLAPDLASYCGTDLRS